MKMYSGLCRPVTVSRLATSEIGNYRLPTLAMAALGRIRKFSRTAIQGAERPLPQGADVQNTAFGDMRFQGTKRA